MHNRRKNKIAPSFEPERTQEMLEAFSDAMASDADFEAWFSEPWRDGRNAVRMCLFLENKPTSFVVDPGVGVRSGDDTPRYWLVNALARDHSQLTTEDYERAEAYRYDVSRTDASRYGVLLDTALAIYANWIARSDAGGVVPNVFLSAAFNRLMYSGELREDHAQAAVGMARATDAGIPWIVDASVSAEAAKHGATHRWLWLNRRYHMAYALARA
jgi:hypothetical protein